MRSRALRTRYDVRYAHVSRVERNARSVILGVDQVELSRGNLGVASGISTLLRTNRTLALSVAQQRLRQLAFGIDEFLLVAGYPLLIRPPLPRVIGSKQSRLPFVDGVFQSCYVFGESHVVVRVRATEDGFIMT